MGRLRRDPRPLALALLLTLALGHALVSLHWRAAHDAPLLLYAGSLMADHGLTPYRDFFEMNPPGAFAIHRVAAELVGTSDLRFRLLDLVWLVAIGACSALALRGFGRCAALAGPALFALSYLALGPHQSFQREYVCLLPLAAALALALGGARIPLAPRALGIGLGIGAAASVKPPLLLALPPIAAGLWLLPGRDERRPRALAIGAAAGLLGLASVPLALAAWLASRSALAPFLEMAGDYWPLYAEIGSSGALHRGPLDRLRDLGATLRMAAAYPFLALVALGATASLGGGAGREPRRRVRLAVLAALAASLAAYVWVGGKLWTYHAIPLYWSLSLLAGLALADAGTAQPGPATPAADARLRTALVVLFAALALSAPIGIGSLLRGEPLEVKQGDVDRIEAFLAERLAPGDRVQPLDVTGGAVHAMWLVGARVATPFLYDFHFYHHPESATVRGLRARLLGALESEPPRWIVRFHAPWRPHGPGAARDFPELERLLAARYRSALEAERFAILERRDAGETRQASRVADAASRW